MLAHPFSFSYAGDSVKVYTANWQWQQIPGTSDLPGVVHPHSIRDYSQYSPKSLTGEIILMESFFQEKANQKSKINAWQMQQLLLETIVICKLIITHLFGQRKQKVIPEEIFFVIYCPIIPRRQVWMDGILFYIFKSSVFEK